MEKKKRFPEYKSRDELLIEAYDGCLRELYLNSEPSIDLNDLIEEGFVDDEKNPLRAKHLIEDEVMEDIIEDFMVEDIPEDILIEEVDTLVPLLEELLVIIKQLLNKRTLPKLI